ncbi:MAG: ribosome maturation factor RimM [Actinomycetota bacterium]
MSGSPSTSPSNARLEVARIGKAHGLRGEVVVVPITNVASRFVVGARLFCDDEKLTIASSRPNQGAFVVRFEGVDDRTEAERLRNRVLTAEPLAAPPAGEIWVHEVIGAEVRDRTGTVLGRVESVEANPAHDLLVLEEGGLIPMVFVVEHDSGVIVVEVPDGLL